MYHICGVCGGVQYLLVFVVVYHILWWCTIFGGGGGVLCTIYGGGGGGVPYLGMSLCRTYWLEISPLKQYNSQSGPSGHHRST